MQDKSAIHCAIFAATIFIAMFSVKIAAQAACPFDTEFPASFDGIKEFDTPARHPLTGSFVDLRGSENPATLCSARKLSQLAACLREEFRDPRSAAAGPRLLVLGEVHDNPQHHRLRVGRNGAPQTRDRPEHKRQPQRHPQRMPSPPVMVVARAACRCASRAIALRPIRGVTPRTPLFLLEHALSSGCLPLLAPTAPRQHCTTSLRSFCSAHGVTVENYRCHPARGAA